MTIKLLEDIKVLPYYELFKAGNYKAHLAVNQPNWQEEGLVFISNGATDLLLSKDDYQIVSK